MAGGLRDTLIRSELCSLADVLPPTHALTAVSTQVPHVWAEIDHNAGMWCNQIVRVLARMLHALVEPATAQPTRPPAERVAIFRDHLLSPIPALLDLSAPRHEHALEPTPQPSSAAILAKDALRRVWFSPPSPTEAFEWNLAEQVGSFHALSSLPVTVTLCEGETCVDATRNASAPIPLSRSILRRFHTLTREAHVVALTSSVLQSYSRLIVAVHSQGDEEKEFLLAHFGGTPFLCQSKRLT